MASIKTIDFVIRKRTAARDYFKGVRDAWFARFGEPVTAERCREEVEGYPSGQDRAAFERTYGDVTRTLDSWLVIITAVMALMLAAGVSDTMLVAVAGP